MAAPIAFFGACDIILWEFSVLFKGDFFMDSTKVFSCFGSLPRIGMCLFAGAVLFLSVPGLPAVAGSQDCPPAPVEIAKSSSDSREAKKIPYMKYAAKNGDVYAQCRLGCMYYMGTGGVSQDYSEALKWFNMAAKKGDPDAQYNIGMMYFAGNGVKQSYSEASKFFRQSADKGNAKAQYSLGYMYFYGNGVEQSDFQALKYFLKSGQQGNADAQYHLGLMYNTGRSVTEDANKAFGWFKKSAYQGNAAAMFSLGRMYDEGRGVRRDRNEANRLYNKAAEKGNRDAIKILNPEPEKPAESEGEAAGDRSDAPAPEGSESDNQ